MEKNKKSPKLFWAIVSFLLFLAGLAFQKEDLSLSLGSKIFFVAGIISLLIAYYKAFWDLTRKDAKNFNNEA